MTQISQEALELVARRFSHVEHGSKAFDQYASVREGARKQASDFLSELYPTFCREGRCPTRHPQPKRGAVNLYLLKRRGHVDYDEAAGFLVRAASSEAARGRAASNSKPGLQPGDEGARTWLESELSTCKEIASEVAGPTAILMRDFRAG